MMGEMMYDDYLLSFFVQVPLYDKQIINYFTEGGRKKHLKKGGKNKLLNGERRQYLNSTEGIPKDHRMCSKLLS